MRTRWTGVTLALLVLSAAASVGVVLTRYPEVLHDPDRAVWIALTIVVFAGYAIAAVLALVRPDSPQRRTGFWFGVAAGLAWLGEIWTQAPARLPTPLEHVIPAACAAVAALITLAAGTAQGIRHGSLAKAAQVGVWAGLVSGAALTAGMIAIQLANLDLLARRSDYQAELVHSGTTNMAAYLAGDAVAASLTHMVINVVLGLIGALIGGVVATAARVRAPVA